MNRARASPLVEAFFSSENIQFIQDKISEKLFSMTGGMKIRIAMDNDVVNTIIETANRNLGLVRYPLPQALAFMNASVIEHESQIAYQSLVRKELFRKYFIDEDRIRVFPYGEMTKQTKGENVISGGGYHLSHPWKRSRPDALLFGNGMAPVDPKCFASMSKYRNNQTTTTTDSAAFWLQQPKLVPSVGSCSGQLGSAVTTPSSYYNEDLSQAETIYAPIYGYLQPKNSKYSSDI